MSDTSDTITHFKEAIDLLIDERDAYHDELEKLKQENNQLRKDKEIDEPQVTDWSNNMPLLEARVPQLKDILRVEAHVHSLKRENNQLREQIFELTKDQIRVDWLQSNDLTLRSWEEGDVWAKAGMYTIREFIDQAMEEEMRELK